MKTSAHHSDAPGLRPLQHILNRMVRGVARKRPEIFERLGSHGGCAFLIDPVNLPFSFLLYPDRKNPRLSVVGKDPPPRHDAAIRGRLLALLALIDGKIDGDALFFSRRLDVTGNVAATVALRNALDDLKPSALESLTPRPLKPLLGLGRHLARRIAHAQERQARKT